MSLSRRQAQLSWRLSPAARRQVLYADLMSDVDIAKEVRLFGLGAFLHRRLLTELRSANAAERDLARRTLRIHASVALLAAVVAGGGLMWTVAGVTGGRLTLGDVALFVAGTTRC